MTTNGEVEDGETLANKEEAIKKERTKFRTVISKAYNRFITNRPFDEEAVLNAGDMLDEIDLALEATDSDRDIHLAHDYRRKRQEMFTKPVIHQFIQPTAQAAPSQQSNSSFTRPKLPAYEPPKFNGDSRTYSTFENEYISTIYNDKSLDWRTKWWFLNRCLVDEARKYIENLECSNDNLDLIIKQLDKEHNSPAIRKQLFFNQLDSLKPIDDATPTAQYRKLHTEFVLLNRRAKNMKLDDTFRNSVLRISFRNLLPRNFKKDIDMQNQTDELDVFIDAMEKQIKVLEELDAEECTKGRNFAKPLTTPTTSGNRQPPTGQLICAFCQGNHLNKDCQLNLDQREQYITDKRLCRRCFDSNHLFNDCPRTDIICRQAGCNQPHFTFMCRQSPRNRTSNTTTNWNTQQQANMWPPSNLAGTSNQATATPPAQPSQANQFQMRPATNVTNQQVHQVANGSHQGSICPPINNSIHYMTCMARVNNKPVRITLDPGGGFSFITSAATSRLQVPITKGKPALVGVFMEKGVKSVFGDIAKVTLESTDGQFKDTLDLYVVPTLGNADYPVPNKEVTSYLRKHGITLNDDQSYEAEILIGLDYVANITKPNEIKLSKYVKALETKLGWVVLGSERDKSLCNDIARCNLITPVQAESEHDTIEIEKCTDLYERDENSQVANQTAKKLIDLKRAPDNRYITKLPWWYKNLTNNHHSAVQQLIKLEKSLISRRCREQFEQALYEYPQNGHIERAFSNPSNASHMPHHAMHTEESETTKHRVVFDATSKGPNGRSLNDKLMKENGTSFVQAAKDFKLLRANMKTAMNKFTAEHTFDWRFIHTHAPWFSGFCERLVGSVKRALISSIAAFQVTKKRITPAHYMCGRRLLLLPDAKIQNVPPTLHAYITCHRMSNGFWRGWREEYLSKLQLFRKQHSVTPISPGDVVHVCETNPPRGTWPLAIVKRLANEHRMEVKYPDGKHHIRAKHNLLPLEINVNEGENQQEDHGSEPSEDGANSH